GPRGNHGCRRQQKPASVQHHVPPISTLERRPIALRASHNENGGTGKPASPFGWSAARGMSSGSCGIPDPPQSLTDRSRSALLMTVTELRLIAALAIIGLSSRP